MTQFSSPQYVDLGPWGFAAWWVFLLAVHLVTFGYNTAYAMFYYALQNTYLYATLDYVGIGMPAKDHHTIANVNAVMASMHGFCIVLMIGASIKRRELAFSPWSEDENDMELIQPFNTPSSRIKLVKLISTQFYAKVWGRQGFLGVNGVSFHAILIAREVLETALQTIQAYRMSWYLPRVLLNRFFLIFLVLNCWSSVLVYSVVFKRNEARRRFACLLCDCFLDLVSCIGVPLLVVMSYVGQYNAEITGFDLEKWYDDEWVARVMNEFQLVLVTSWSDLASRTVFSFGLLSTTTSLKELLRRSQNENTTTKLSEKVEPNLDGILTQQSSKLIKIRNGVYNDTGLHSQRARVVLPLVHLLFALWGVIVLGLHIQASSQPQLPQCILQVHPWAVSKPACYLAVLDCYQFGISGKTNEVEAKWREFDRSTVVTLVMRHCPCLEIPSMISDFHHTGSVKVYNSTIKSWEASAAVTNTNHPNLVRLYLIRVIMPNGILPDGILSPDFPLMLYDIEIYFSNLRELPDNLDSIWLTGTTIYIEYSQLTTVNPALTRLEPYYLALTGNPITEVPAEIFQVAGMEYLGLGSTNISQLPRNVTDLSPLLSYLILTNTNVSFFWSWIDVLVERNAAFLLLDNSTYCTDLDRISTNQTNSFRVLASSEYSLLLTDPTKVKEIRKTVSCDNQVAVDFYPIEEDDALNAII